MAASFPASAKTFTTKVNATAIDAAHVNDLQAEVTAIEQVLLGTTTAALIVTGSISVTGAITATGAVTGGSIVGGTIAGTTGALTSTLSVLGITTIGSDAGAAGTSGFLLLKGPTGGEPIVAFYENGALKGFVIYDNTNDTMRYGGGSDTTVGLAASATGFLTAKTNLVGTHTITGAGTGANALAITNTTAGTGNFGRVDVYGDNVSSALRLQGYSDSYTTSTFDVQAGASVMGLGVGGLSVGASNASGVLRFYAGGTTRRMLLSTAGVLTLDAYTAATFAAGDKYLVVSATGVVHVSALGPAS